MEFDKIIFLMMTPKWNITQVLSQSKAQVPTRMKHLEGLKVCESLH